MSEAYMCHAIGVVCLVYSAVTGYLSARRARSCAYPGHWCGAAAVFALAVLAWPQRVYERPVAPRAAVKMTADELFLASFVGKFMELKSGRNVGQASSVAASR